jgi:eukaryotic-like serine/threonine-protein kinase
MEGSSVPSVPGATTLGKYRLIAELGHGGMAEVYLAVSGGPAGFNKLVVIKQIRPQLAEDPEFLGMFLDEARLAARLSHPNVVQTNEVGQDGQRYFIAMEYLEGQPWNRILHRVGRSGPVPLGVQLRVLIDVLAGLQHAHELTDYDGTPLRVVHRDVTPHNVFVTYDGQIKVVDFGIAKALNSSSETRTGVLKGKVSYMSPEQARGETVDRRADLFSVGVMMWEALTGRRLWKGVPDVTILHRLLAGELPSPRSLRPDLDEGLEAICMKALSLEREDRFSTALELQAALEETMDRLGERTQARDVGKLVLQHFEVDRARIKTLVEEQLRAKVSSEPGRVAPLPLLDPHSHSSSSLDRPTADGTLRVVGIDGTPSAVFPAATPASQSNASLTNASPVEVTLAAEGGGAARAGGRKLMAILAVAGGAFLAAGLWAVTRSTPPPGSAPAATSEATTASPAATAAPAPAQVELRISATPAEAHLFLDDQLLAGNPFKGSYPASAAQHQLRVEAAGFTPVTRRIALDKDYEIDLALQPDAAAPAAPVYHRPTGQPVPTDDDMHRPTTRPKRNVDSNNPYGQ